MSTQKETFASS